MIRPLYYGLTKKTEKYTSHNIQNEILQIMASQILREIGRKIEGAIWFSLLADECTDVANKEQHHLFEVDR